MSTSTLSDQAFAIARDILSSVNVIDGALKEMERDPMQAMRDQKQVLKVRAEAEVLYSKICRHFETNKDAHRAAFDRKFLFPSRFNDPATLEVIMSFIYSMIIAYERTLISTMITDPSHIGYAQRLAGVNREEISRILIKY